MSDNRPFKSYGPRMARTRRKPWFRTWDEMLTDPKMFDLPDSQWGIWLKFLCLANQQTQRGFIIIESSKKPAINTLATALHTRSDRLLTALRQFADRNMVEYDLDDNDGWVNITNWNNRQFASDDVTARVLKFKERKRLRKRPVSEQNRAESLPSDPCSVSFPIDQGDQAATSPGEATLPESPLNLDDDDILAMADAVAKKHDCLEILEVVRGHLSEGVEREFLYHSLNHTLIFYEPKGAITPIVYFRLELKERSGSLKAGAEAG